MDFAVLKEDLKQYSHGYYQVRLNPLQTFLTYCKLSSCCKSYSDDKMVTFFLAQSVSKGVCMLLVSRNNVEIVYLKLPSPSIEFACKNPLNVYQLYSSKALWFTVKIDKIRNHLTWMKKFLRFWFGEHFYIWKCQIGQYFA